MKLSNDQKKTAKAIAVYTLLYPVVMLVAHRIRTGSFDWSDFLVSLLVALVVGALWHPVLRDRFPRPHERRLINDYCYCLHREIVI